jgi:hypothetical protein
MKLLRIWVPDPNAPGFEEEALEFIEAAARETWPE